jgi:integrase
MARRNAGEGSIFQRNDGRWCAQLDLGWQNGRRARKYIYGATAAEVQNALLKARADHAAGLPVAVEQQTVAQFLERWLEDSVKQSVRPLTHEQYRQHVKLYLAPLLGHHRLGKLAPQHVRAFFKLKLEDGLSPRMVQLSLVILRKALGQALKDGLLGRNVAKLVDGPRVKRFEGATLSLEQAQAFLDAAAGERLEALYAAALAVGLRMGEVLGLRWTDIDLDRRILTVNRILARIGRSHRSTLQFVEPKTSRSRRAINLPDVVMRALRVHMSASLRTGWWPAPAGGSKGLCSLPLSEPRLSLTHCMTTSSASLRKQDCRKSGFTTCGIQRQASCWLRAFHCARFRKFSAIAP